MVVGGRGGVASMQWINNCQAMITFQQYCVMDIYLKSFKLHIPNFFPLHFTVSPHSLNISFLFLFLFFNLSCITPSSRLSVSLAQIKVYTFIIIIFPPPTGILSFIILIYFKFILCDIHSILLLFLKIVYY